MTIEVKDSDKEVFQFEWDAPSDWISVEKKDWKSYLNLRFSCAVVEEKSNRELIYYKLVLVDFVSARSAIRKIIPSLPEMYILPEVIELIVNEIEWLRKLPYNHKSMRKRIGLFFGPKDMLMDWSWGRYCLAEEQFRKYVDSLSLENPKLEKQARSQLFAVLYSPFGFWSSRSADVYKKFVFLVSRAKTLEAIENYRGLRHWVQQVYSPAFPQASDNGEGSGATMRSLTVAMAGPKFGTYKQVLEENMHNILIYQCQLMDEVNRAKS
jgi:hypothetical protein